MWSTAPYLLNNTVGKLSPDEDPYTREGYNPSPDVASRLRAFNDGIRKMLWPDTRDKDKVLGAKGVFMIDRTTATSYLQVPARYVPEAVRKLRNWVTIPVFDQEGGIKIGPIPAGTPVNLIANLRLMSENTDLNSEAENAKQWKDLLVKLIRDLNALGPNATDDKARKIFANVGENMVALSTCPDYEVNRGHYFGTELFPGETPLKNEEKEALIEFLKTF